MVISTHRSIITLNVNGLNAVIKRQGSWVNKKSRPLYILFEDSHQNERPIHTKIKGLKKGMSSK